MSPSRHQVGHSSTDYDSTPEKYLRTKDMETVLALVRGIRREDRARSWLSACNRIGVHERVQEEVVEKLRELKND